METCLSPTGTALNTIVNYTDGFYNDLCQLLRSSSEKSYLTDNLNCNNEEYQTKTDAIIGETASTLQLFIVQMLFYQAETINDQINRLLRSQVNYLSIVNQDLQHQNSNDLESLECTRCERLGVGEGAGSMTCRRVDRRLEVNMTKHRELFRKFNQATAACTQRLDSLLKALEATRLANIMHIQAYCRIFGSDGTDLRPSTSR